MRAIIRRGEGKTIRFKRDGTPLNHHRASFHSPVRVLSPGASNDASLNWPRTERSRRRTVSYIHEDAAFAMRQGVVRSRFFLDSDLAVNGRTINSFD